MTKTDIIIIGAGPVGLFAIFDISTNGKSPTLAKRIRQWLEGFLPEETDALLDKLYEYRNSLKGYFEQKIVAMNALTEKLLKKND